MDDDLDDILNELDFGKKTPAKPTAAKDNAAPAKSPVQAPVAKPAAKPSKPTDDEESDFDASDLGNIDSMDDILFGKKKPAADTDTKKTTSPVSRRKTPEKADSIDVWSDDEKPAPAKSALKKPTMSLDNDDTLFGSSTGSKLDARRPPSSSGPPSGQGQGAKPKPRSDDDDDLMDSLGLSSPRTEKPVAPKPASKGDEPRVGGAKSILDELLGKDTTARHLERPGTGERREFTLAVGASRHDDDKPTSAGKDDDDPLFDGYMPSSVASRPNSRRSVRFESDNERPPTGAGRQGRGATSAFMSDVGKDGSDWLELALGSKGKVSVDAERPHSEGQVTSRQGVAKKDDIAQPSDWLGLSRLGSPNVTPREDSQGKGLRAELDDNDWLEDKNRGGAKAAPPKAADTAAGKGTSEGSRLASVRTRRDSNDTLDWLTAIENKLPPPVTEHKPPTPAHDTLDDTKRSSPGTAKSGDMDFLNPEPRSMRQRRRSKDDLDSTAKGRTSGELDLNRTGDQWGDISLPMAGSTAPIPDYKHEDTPAVTTDDFDAMLAEKKQRRSQQPASDRRTADMTLTEGHYTGFLSTSQWSPHTAVSGPGHTGPVRTLASQPPATFMMSGGVNKEHVEQLLDTVKRQHDEATALLEDGFKKQLKVVEEAAEKREKRLRDENEVLTAHNSQLLKQLEQERVDSAAVRSRVRDEWEAEKHNETERLRKMFREEIDQLYEEHARALERLRRAKESEVSAVATTGTHSKALQEATGKLDESAVKLRELESLVTSDHENIRDERKKAEELRNKQLQELQQRLTDMEVERVSLQSQIVSLQAQLVEQTSSVEQARSALRLEENKLRAMQEALQADRMAVMRQVHAERADTDKAKSELLEEQRSLLAQLHAERRQLAEEKAHFTLSQQLRSEQDQRDMQKQSRMEVEVEAGMKAVREERARIAAERQELQKRKEEVDSGLAKVEEEMAKVKADKEKLDKALWQLKQKSREVEEAAEEVARSQEECSRMQSEAKSRDVIHVKQTELLQRDMEQMRSRERAIIEEKAALSHERQSLDEMRAKQLCVSCKRPVTAPPMPMMHQYTSQSYASMYVPGAGGYMQGVADISESIEMDRAIRMYKLAAQKDKAFLSEERFYLQNIQQHPRLGFQ